MLRNNGKEKASMLRILGTDFIVDFNLSEFRQVDNPSNRIPFDILQYDQKYDGYLLLFDKDTKNVYQGPIPTEEMNPDVQRILIPELMQLGWVGRIAHAYTIDKNGQVIDVESNKLPTIKIDSNDFMVDLCRNEFRQTDNPDNRIFLDELFPIGPGHIGFFFDPRTKNVFRGTMDEKAKGIGVKLIELPPLAIMDPEGMKRRIREATAQARADRKKPIVIPKETRPKDQECFRSRTKRKGRGI